jgi:tetratricopeptide (TPR) repeat protein
LSATRSCVAFVCVALLGALLPQPARADDLADFERARASYDAQRYAEAVQKLELLVGGETPRLATRAIVLEARKYLGASYLFVARRADAERQFALLLSEDPQYQIDPTTFPAEVREVFASVRTRLEREARALADARDREEAARRAEEAERLIRDRARLERLRELALTETIVEENSRWIAAIPFGIGQFQNGQSGLGIAFAVTEGVLGATALTMKILHDTLPSPSGYPSNLDIPAVRRLEAAYAITNYLAMSALAVVAIIGIVDAQLRFVPSFTRTRSRTAPEELREPAPTATLGVGPTGAVFRLQF